MKSNPLTSFRKTPPLNIIVTDHSVVFVVVVVSMRDIHNDGEKTSRQTICVR